MSSMFGLAHRLSSNSLLCYVNADIMLTSQFVEALRVIHAVEPRFLMTGRRTNLDVEKHWDFSHPSWEAKLRDRAATDGVEGPSSAMDYFAFPRGVFDEVPPFVVGRDPLG